MSSWQDNVAVLEPARPRQLTEVQGTLALELGAVPLPRLAPPELTEPAHPTAELASALSGADVVAVSPGRRRELAAWARTFAQASVEIVLGDRPVSQLVRWTSPRVQRDLAHRARVVAQATVRQGAARRDAIRPQVGPVRLCFVRADAAEASFTVRYGARHRALAARLEERAGRWECVALEFG